MKKKTSDISVFENFILYQRFRKPSFSSLRIHIVYLTLADFLQINGFITYVVNTNSPMTNH